MGKYLCLLFCVTVLLFATLPGAYATTITFDEFPAGNNSVAITNLYSNLGVTFGSDNSGIWGGLSKGNPGLWGLEGTNGPQFLGNGGSNNGFTYVTSIFFSTPVSEVSFDVSRGFGSTLGQTVTASAYSDAALVSSTIFLLGDVNQWSTFIFGFGGIDKLIIKSSNVNSFFTPYGIDNLQFVSGPTVPEPGSLLLLASGLVALALAARRQGR